MFNRLRIQRAILDRVFQGPFYKVAYDQFSKPKTVDPDTAETVEPGTALCNEISEVADVDARKGLYLGGQITSWRFEVELHFPCEVVMEEFRRSLLDSPIALGHDQDHDLEAVILIYQGARMEHPRQRTRTSEGSHILLTFDTLSRR